MNHQPTENVQKVTTGPQKRQVIDTNFAGKMDLENFIHIALAPAVRIPESVLHRTTIEMSTRDGSHPAVLVRCMDLARFEFQQLPYFADRICQDSHGMTSRQLATWLMEKYPNIHPGSQCAIYYYQKIKNPQ
jgi:hypothetical protein